MKIKIAITDKRIPREAVARLSALGFHTITLEPFSRLGEGVASHTDMLIARSEDILFSYADYCEENPLLFDTLYKLLSPVGVSFRFLSDEARADYPHDAALNVLVMGRHVFAKEDSVSQGLLGHFLSLGYRTVGVKQGYPACTVLKISENAAATADQGMARAMSDAGIKVSIIEEGHIILPPFKYGFIGGCAGRHNNTVYFAGCIEKHPSYRIIKEAAEEEGVELVSLGDFPLIDVGGILFAEYDLDEDGENRH